MEFGPQKVECLYLYILFFAFFSSKESVSLWLPFVLVFYLKHKSLRLHHFIILPIFYFPRLEWVVVGGEVSVFSFGQEGGCQNIQHVVGGSEKILPLLNILSVPPPHHPPCVYIMNAAFSRPPIKLLSSIKWPVIKIPKSLQKRMGN